MRTTTPHFDFFFQLLDKNQWCPELGPRVGAGYPCFEGPSVLGREHKLGVHTQPASPAAFRASRDLQANVNT